MHHTKQDAQPCGFFLYENAYMDVVNQFNYIVVKGYSTSLLFCYLTYKLVN